MGSRRGRVACLRAVLAGLALLGGLSSAAAQIDTLVQPRGVVVPGLLGGAHPVASITTGHDANTYLNMLPPKGPFDETQPAGVIRTTEPVEYYVRMYTPGSSDAGGPWIMRASAIRGLTPEQIRDRFALPFPVVASSNAARPLRRLLPTARNDRCATDARCSSSRCSPTGRGGRGG